MIIRNATLDQIARAADNAGVVVYNANAHGSRKPYFRLQIQRLDNRYVARSLSGRKAGGAVCFHGHYNFFDALFQIAPKAEVETGRHGAVSYTAGTFRQRADEFGDRVEGSDYHGYAMIRELCDCEK